MPVRRLSDWGRAAPKVCLREAHSGRHLGRSPVGGFTMYRVFEALDELVTIVEEARGLPMTASCIVPRGDVLELLDDVRDALPGEVDDAQDVLDHRDQMIGYANQQPTPTVGDANAEAHGLVNAARAEAEATVAGARAEADRLVQEA